MYKDTVTLFNRKTAQDGTWDSASVTWYPTVLTGVNLNTDRAAIVKQYGEQTADRAVLNVSLPAVKPYLLPKEWSASEAPAENITFTPGEAFDFFWAGEWTGGTVSDSDYPAGFYQYMEDTRDNVFAVSSVSLFTVIPHLEVTGK